jgi:hypothetical protein
MSTSQFRERSLSGWSVASAASMAVVAGVELASDDDDDTSLSRPLFRFGLEEPMGRERIVGLDWFLVFLFLFSLVSPLPEEC